MSSYSYKNTNIHNIVIIYKICKRDVSCLCFFSKDFVVGFFMVEPCKYCKEKHILDNKNAQDCIKAYSGFSFNFCSPWALA